MDDKAAIVHVYLIHILKIVQKRGRLIFIIFSIVLFYRSTSTKLLTNNKKHILWIYFSMSF